MDLETPAAETPAEDKTVITESPTGGESDVCEIDTRREPYEGMLFESEDAAKIFYDEYARRAGFSTRIISSRKSERDGSIISRHLACNKEGFNANRRKSGRVQIRKRESIREGCRAMILVKREKPGRWVVTKFEKEHNHLLLSSGKDGPSPDEKDRKIRELSMELHRANQKLEACQEQLQTVMTYIEEHTKCLSKTVEEAVKDIQKVESGEQKKS